MATKTVTERAQGGQVFFPLPVYTGTPTATVNGVSRGLTAVPSGVVLASAAAQDDTVVVTFTADDPENFRAESFSPATGATIAPTQFCNLAIITPAATIAALTITFPPSPSKEGQQFRVTTTQTITAVTWTGGTRLGGPSTLGAGLSASFEWSVAKQEWVFIN